MDYSGTLLEGLRTLSLDEEITFVQYKKKVMPLDGYIFWLRLQEIKIKGSLHYSSNSEQRIDENITINRFVFTTGYEVTQFNDIDKQTIWIGEFQDIKFAFSQRGFFYSAAKLFHYSGDGIYPVMQNMLVDLGSELDDATLIVSNSLPAWLTIVDYLPIWLELPNPRVTLYPSYLTDDNIIPPYGSVHIEPRETMAYQTRPFLNQVSHYSDLASDHVTVTLFGLTNLEATAWLNTVLQYSYDYNVIGMMDMPIIQDEKQIQNEINVIAMKKIIHFTVSYNQRRMEDITRQMIVSAKMEFFLPCFDPVILSVAPSTVNPIDPSSR